MRASLAGLAFVLAGCASDVMLDVDNQSAVAVDRDEFGVGEVELGAVAGVAPGAQASSSVKGQRPGADASYRVRVVQAGAARTETFGYHTGGVPLAESLRVVVRDDTLLVEAVER